MINLNQLQQILNTSEKLNEFAAHYNWDDGFEVPVWIINNPQCDRGTALMMYWRAEPQYFCKYATCDDIPNSGWQISHYDFIREVEEKYINGFYKFQEILFNPRYDMSSGMEGYDWTQEDNEIPQHRKIPAEMFEPSIQDANWEKAGKPIKPIKKIDYDNLFKPIDERIKQLEDELFDENSD
ncbi:MAG: DUF4274 domain-containing protein [Anaerolineales bacterium]|nr:DUF4274 domain-containing protein [Anaerolineales bacterium]